MWWLWTLFKAKTKKLPIKLPKRALYDIELQKYAKRLKIPHFRGVFMRDTLPEGSKVYESGILNLDLSCNEGTHWVAYIKRKNSVLYFDSFGYLKPPLELVKYFGANTDICYNSTAYQTYNQINCGHLCLEFLYKNK